MSFFKKRVKVPPVHEIGVFISADFKRLLNEEFGVEKISNSLVGWQFSRPFQKIGINQGDFLVGIDQKDVRQETNVQVLFEKCFRKNVNEDIYFSIVRKEDQENMINLAKKVRYSIDKVKQNQPISGNSGGFIFNRERLSGSRNLLHEMVLGALYLVICLSLP